MKTMLTFDTPRKNWSWFRALPLSFHGVWVVSKLLMNEINGMRWKRRVFISFSAKRVKLPTIRAQLPWGPPYFSPTKFIPFPSCLPPYLSLHLFCLLSPPHLSHFFPLAFVTAFSFPAAIWMTYPCLELECSVSWIQNDRRAINT